MSNPKTLKDISKIYIEIGETEIVKTEDLKEEAIKWMEFRGRGEISQWIEYFFNITKEDLKLSKDVHKANEVEDAT